jgi:hypothetical protein
VNVIDRAKLKPFGLILGFGTGSQQDHRNGSGLRIGLEPPTDLGAIHVGHRHVEQDEVRLVGGTGMFERLGTAGRHPGAILILQNGERRGNVGRRVVDDQNGLVRHNVLIPLIYRERLAPLRPPAYGIHTSLARSRPLDGGGLEPAPDLIRGWGVMPQLPGDDRTRAF